MTAPEKIYLQLDMENGQPTEDATWCVDQIEDYDTEYTRTDLSLAMVAAALERGFWAGRACGWKKAEIDAALAALKRETGQ
ncbi:hypothetical protein [Celeribacter sp. SCSIO 80788]|uniref:hypothetical protein n=1 Tax=Celeribacter sp. SCSIO 80788 TaxID=3117013 RepID=UPI003DA6395B